MWSGKSNHTRLAVFRMAGATMVVKGWMTPDDRFAWDPATLKPFEGKVPEPVDRELNKERLA